MASKKPTPKKPTKATAKIKTPPRKVQVMSDYDEPQERQDETNGEEHQDENQEQETRGQVAAAAPQFPPQHVSPQGSGAPPMKLPAMEKVSLDQDQQFVLILAAIIHAKPGPSTIQDSYRTAKNLIQTLVDDEKEPDEDEEEETVTETPN